MAIRKRGIAWYKVPKNAAWACGVCSAIIAACLRTEPDDWSGKWVFAGKIINWAHDTAWILIPVLTLAIPVCLYAARRLKKSWINLGIQELLEHVQKYAFRNIKKDFPHNHRVTLFRKVRRLIDSKEWLVMKGRSGHMTHGHKTRFRVGDDLKECQGVAGLAWARGGYLIDDLPEITNISPPQDVEKYAKLTNVTKGWIRERLAEGKPLARSYFGISVEVDGVLWGVMVLDSIKTGTIRKRGSDHYYSLVSLALGKILERD